MNNIWIDKRQMRKGTNMEEEEKKYRMLKGLVLEGEISELVVRLQTINNEIRDKVPWETRWELSKISIFLERIEKKVFDMVK